MPPLLAQQLAPPPTPASGAGSLLDLDWLWLTSAALLALTAAAILYWSLLHDRAKGRPRCPKCWYDMSGAPTITANNKPAWRCPECGRLSTSPRHLLHTRRRWRPALPGFFLLLLAAASALWPDLRNDTWPRRIPSAVLVLIVPVEPDPARTQRILARQWSGNPAYWRTAATFDERLIEEAWERYRKDGRLSAWQSRTLINRALDAVKPDPAACLQTPPRWPLNIPVRVALSTPDSLFGLAGLGGLRLIVRAEGEEPIPGGQTTLPPFQSPRDHITVTLDIYRDRDQVFHATAAKPIAIQGDTITFFEHLDSPALNTRVRAALDPRLVQGRDGLELIVNDRSSDPLWEGIDFGIFFNYEVRDGETILGEGSDEAWWTLQRPKNWQLLTPRCALGALARLADPAARPIITITGDAVPAWAEFSSQYHATPRPAVWTGRFTTPLRTTTPPPTLTNESP